jgi:predicted acetyltransferase
MSDMEPLQTTLPAGVEVLPALPEQESILANLLEFYVYDFSEFMGLQLDEAGRFGYAQLPLYWQEANRYPLLIKVNGNWAGFALVRQGSQISGATHSWDMAEFFIMRGHRRLGIGQIAASEVWKRFPGSWEVRVLDWNKTAQAFWGRAISEFIGKTVAPMAFEKPGKVWQVFAFESQGAA